MMKKLAILGKCLLSIGIIIAVMLFCCHYAGENDKVVLSEFTPHFSAPIPKESS